MSIFGGVLKVFSAFRSDKAKAAFGTVMSLVTQAMPIVEVVASLTPTMADDEILALFKRYALPSATARQFLALPQEDRGPALLKVASAALAREVPGTPTHILDSAVQLALVASRAKAGE